MHRDGGGTEVDGDAERSIDETGPDRDDFVGSVLGVRPNRDSDPALSLVNCG